MSIDRRESRLTGLVSDPQVAEQVIADKQLQAEIDSVRNWADQRFSQLEADIASTYPTELSSNSYNSYYPEENKIDQEPDFSGDFVSCPVGQPLVKPTLTSKLLPTNNPSDGPVEVMFGVWNEMQRGGQAVHDLVANSGISPRKVTASVVAASALLAGANNLGSNQENQLNSAQPVDTEDISARIVISVDDKGQYIELPNPESQDIDLSLNDAAVASGLPIDSMQIEAGRLYFNGDAVNAPEQTLLAAYQAAAVPDRAPAQQLEEERRELQATIVAEARKYLGIKEDPSTPNHSPEIDEYFQMGLKGPNAEWCSSYISRVLSDSGVPLSDGDQDGHKGPEWQLEFVNNVYLWAKEHDAQVVDQSDISQGFLPEAGDLVIYNKEGKLGDARSGVNHIGIVQGYDQETGKLTTIEGNQDDAVTERTYKMEEMMQLESGKKLAGFIRIPELIETNNSSQQAETEVEEDAPDFDTAMNDFLEFVSKGEGGWDDVNRGKAYDTPLHSEKGRKAYEQIFGDRMLSDLTIAEVREQQDEDLIMAVGRYQYLPSTLQAAIDETGIDVNLKFDAETQNRLTVDYLILGSKRPALRDYITGESEDIDAAIEAMAYEWASLVGVDGIGKYNGIAGNHAESIKKRDDQALHLISLRRAYADKLNPEQSSQESTAFSASEVDSDANSVDVVMVGDSLTYGMDINGVQDIAKTRGMNVIVEAKQGQALEGGKSSGVDTIDSLIDQGTIQEAEVVYLAYGTNKYASDQQFETELRDVIGKIQAVSSAKVMLPLLFAEANGLDYIDSRNKIIAQVAEDYQAKVIDPGAEVSTSSDGIHPTVDGYKQMSERVVQSASELALPSDNYPVTSIKPAPSASGKPKSGAEFKVSVDSDDSQSGTEEKTISGASWFSRTQASNIYEPFFRLGNGQIDEAGLGQWVDSLPQKREKGETKYQTSIDNLPVGIAKENK